MRSIAEKEVFTKRELELYTAACSIVGRLPPEDPDGRPLRCHEVARVVGYCLDLEVIDGRWEYGHEHSWCVIHNKHPAPTSWSILDAYTIGRIPPVQLVCVLSTIPNRYYPEAKRTDIREDVISELFRVLHWVKGAPYGR